MLRFFVGHIQELDLKCMRTIIATMIHFSTPFLVLAARNTQKKHIEFYA